MIKRYSKQKGSALIIALLMMGILMTLALGLSDLVLREIKITNDFVSSGQAFYAAEAGIEEALLDLHQNLPGFERESGMDEKELTYIYSIKNKTQSIPFIDPEIIDVEIAKNEPEKYLYNVLYLNDTFSIPLFTVQDDGTIKNIKDFRIEYFTDANLNPNLIQEAGVSFENIDMLRWKMTGRNTTGVSGRTFFTETIGDYLALADGSNANNPTCIGTERIEHMNFTDSNSGIEYDANCNLGIWKWAREAFQYLGTDTIVRKEDPGNAVLSDPYTIKEFLDTHDFVYLTITNIFNPSVLQGLSDFERRANARIFWRILTPDDVMIREYAKIKSTGSSGNSRKQIEAFVRPDTFLPVFNFSLYRTQVGGAGDKQTPQGYVQP
ncbi:hypothetical protein ACFL3T_04640 [Patescibacteria group bacterium]